MRARRRLTLIALVGLAGGAVAWLERSGWLYAWLPALAPPALMLEADTASGTLIRVADGDTVVVRYHELELPLRLLNLDTAESAHPDASRNSEFGRQAAEWARGHLAGARVRIEFARRGWHIACDQHGRALADLWLDRGAPGPDAADELYAATAIALGWSCYDTTYGASRRHHAALSAAEAQAKAGRLGLWGPPPVAP